MANKIDSIILPRTNVGNATIRNNLIPQKVGIFVWRVLNGRIAVKVELAKRGIDSGSLLCPICKDTPESIDHALLSCKLSNEVWTGIHKWWKINMPAGFDLKMALASTNYSSLPTRSWKTWQAIMWTTSYMLWKNSNQKVFNDDSWCSAKIISEIQVKTFEWIGNRSRKLHKDWLS
ncbi:uncharacterized protein [Rutidosis leptorrhynchoides]|uniref:uncharacterized protein n=1 Tax=Rutidosis leptorrhynchoides TaxID=125765 RepID=UPI003A99AA47